jgi:DNA-binding response OmpR family regulator
LANTVPSVPSAVRRSRASVLAIGASLKESIPVLASSGASIVPCPDEKRALKMLDERRYHAVILDVDLPAMQRMQFLRRVCEDFPHVAVVVVTKSKSLRRGMLAMISGASAYILKPLRPGDVSASLEAALRRKGIESAMCGLSASSDFHLGSRSMMAWPPESLTVETRVLS